MYRVEKIENINTLQRFNKSKEEWSDVLKVIDTPINRLMIIDKSKVKSLRFKSDTPVKLIDSGNIFTAIITGQLQVFKLPHYIAYHNELMQANRSMLHLSTAQFMQQLPQLRDNLILDEEGILNNMLECIGQL